MRNTRIDADMIATADIMIEQQQQLEQGTEDKAKLDYLRNKAKRDEPQTALGAERYSQATALNKEQITPDMDAAIQAEKLEPKFIFQIIGAHDGKRSEPILNTWDGLTELLIDMEHAMAQHNHDQLVENPEHEDTNYQDDYILLVAVINGEETIIPGTPLITVKHFLNLKAQ